MPTEILAETECMRLLATQTVGRLAVQAGRWPLVVPVNFALDGGDVVFRTGPGTKVDSAVHRGVGFQADEIDLASRSGWSVCLVGVAEVVGADELADLVTRIGAFGVRPLESGDKPIWVRAAAHGVTGRRVGPEGLQALQWGSEAYL